MNSAAGKVSSFLTLLKQAFTNLKNNDPVRMAGATAFFSLLGLPPIVVILSQVLSLLFNDHERLVRGRLFGQLAELFGAPSARQLQDISQHLQTKGTDWPSTGISLVLLLITSTTLFAVMKGSLNQLWNVKARPERQSVHLLKDRAIALLIIVGSGLLFTASLSIDRLLLAAHRDTSGGLHTNAFFNGLGHGLSSVILLTIWFALLLAYLPDIRVRWQAVLTGAFVTSLLFLLGAALLSRLLTHQQLSSLYGASASLILILLFMFYCSLIFYYGASFTRQFSQWADLEAEPNANAVAYTIEEVDENQS